MLLATVLLVGCGERADPDWNRAHRIEVEHVGALIDDGGPGGSYGGVANLTLLDDGRLLFWDHYRPTQIRIYDSELSFDTVFGRAGQGPGEFQRPRFHGVIGDTLFVFQESSARLELFDKDDLSYITTRLARVGGPTALAFSPDGYLVASSLGMSSDGVALPLRELDTQGNVRTAFGAEFPVLTGGGLAPHARALDFAPDGALWVLPEFEARLERWVRTGGDVPSWDLDTAFLLPDIEMSDPESFVGIPRTPPEAPPSPHFRGVSHETDGPVWLNLSVPHPDWEERLRPPGEASDEMTDIPATTQRVTRLIAVDPESGEILASRVLDERWMGFIGQGIAYSWDVDQYSVPYVDLWRPRLVSEPADP